MKLKLFFWTIAVAALSSGAGEYGTVRAKWFETVISPEVGSLIAGYADHDVSVAKYDDLLACGLCVVDGSNRVVLVSLDLLGLDYDSIRRIRRDISAATGAPEEGVLVSCTHTHQGPHTRMFSRQNGLKSDQGKSDAEECIDSKYMDFLFGRIAAAAKDMMAKGEWRTCTVGFHTAMVDENRNRRYTTEENRASFNAHRPILHKLTTGIADQEIGTLVLLEDNKPVYVVGNYAAHALTAHTVGLGGLRISSDFPGFYRRYIESESGAKAMFMQGSAGDLVTKDDELGNAAAKRVGENLAMASLLSVISVHRCNSRFVIARPRVGGIIRSFDSRLRAQWRKRCGKERETFDIQCVAIGDVCFVGVPGETVAELGLEIKWNSPFARTYIAYLATGYYGYITPMNLMAAGGYEPQSHRFASRDTLKLVSTAQDAMLDLRGRLYPESNEGEDPYPDNLHSPVVNMPGMYKASKWER